MKPSSPSLLLAVLTLSAGFSLTALADTITLKDGKIYHGTITSETADKVTIEVREKGITDIIVFKRTDIETIVKDPPPPPPRRRQPWLSENV